jgi:hypothetical protein
VDSGVPSLATNRCACKSASSYLASANTKGVSASSRVASSHLASAYTKRVSANTRKGRANTTRVTANRGSTDTTRCASTRRVSADAYVKHYSRSHDAVIRVYDDAGNVIETHEYKGDFKRAKTPTDHRLSAREGV